MLRVRSLSIKGGRVAKWTSNQMKATSGPISGCPFAAPKAQAHQVAWNPRKLAMLRTIREDMILAGESG